MSTALQKAQDWAGLLAIWRAIKRVGAVAAMAVVMGLCGGIVSAIATVWAYGLGMYLGFPIGFVWGGWMGSRMAPRDPVLVFAVAFFGAWTGLKIAEGQTKEGLFLTAAWGAAFVMSTLVAFGVGGVVPVRARYVMAVAAAWGMGLFASVSIVRHLWFSA